VQQKPETAGKKKLRKNSVNILSSASFAPSTAAFLSGISVLQVLALQEKSKTFKVYRTKDIIVNA